MDKELLREKIKKITKEHLTPYLGHTYYEVVEEILALPELQAVREKVSRPPCTICGRTICDCLAQYKPHRPKEIDKWAVLNKLHERDYLDKLHRQIKEGLVGSLRNEYLLHRPMRIPYEQYNEQVNELISLPIFHAIVDMMTANLLHSTADKFVEEILEAINQLNRREG